MRKWVGAILGKIRLRYARWLWLLLAAIVIAYLVSVGVGLYHPGLTPAIGISFPSDIEGSERLWDNARPADWPSWSAFPAEHRGAGRFTSPNVEVAMLVNAEPIDRWSSPVRFMTIIDAGFPMPALRAVRYSQATTVGSRGALTLDPAWQRRLRARRPLVPLAPIWSGLLVNIACAFIVLLIADTLVRIFVSRRRRGRCPRCLYDVRGLASGVCPECGRTLTAGTDG